MLNLILAKPTETMQRDMLDLLKKDNAFFKVFYYLKMRMQYSKNYLLEKIKQTAKDKFLKEHMTGPKVELASTDFKSQKVYMSQKYDLEYKFEEL